MTRDGCLVDYNLTPSGRGVVLTFVLDTGKLARVGISPRDQEIINHFNSPLLLGRWYPLRAKPEGKWLIWRIYWPALYDLLPRSTWVAATQNWSLTHA